jgi:hypothetical protein
MASTSMLFSESAKEFAAPAICYDFPVALGDVIGYRHAEVLLPTFSRAR